MEELHSIRFPGETEAYRVSRNALLQAEIDLRRQIESVAQFRRKLPLGGQLKENYIFEEYNDSSNATNTVPFADLFQGDKNTLIVYSFMYAPQDDAPCPACNSLLNALNGVAAPLRDKSNFVVVAKSPAEKINSWAKRQGWSSLRLLSSVNNSFNSDYHAETPEGYQIPAINVFHRTADGIFHFYNAELLYAASEDGQDPRHADMLWPLWSMFDLTPEGRAANWFPELEYS